MVERVDLLFHQRFQVPKMEVLNRHFGGGVFPYIIRVHTAYTGKYLHFRYLKCLVIVRVDTQPSSPWLVGWLLPQPIGILYEKGIFLLTWCVFRGHVIFLGGIKIKACFSICCFLVGEVE